MLTTKPRVVSGWNSGRAVIVLIVAAASFANARAAEPAAAKCNYERPFEPPTRSPLIPLPPGAVEPEGWLRDWCIAAKDGYTGHMDERDPAFRQAWAKDYKMTGKHLSLWDLGGWPYEGGGYWFDGLAKLGYVLHDKPLIAQAKSRLGVVVDNLGPDSILFMWWLNKNKPDDVSAVYGKGKREEEWPIWANGLMGRTLVGYYAGSGDRRILKALETAYSSNRDWVRLGWSMIHPWPAFETYTWTGNKEIKESLTALFNTAGDDKKRLGWNYYRRPPSDKPGADPSDHGVHFCESTAPWALGYLWTGRREFLDAALRWHEKIEREAMQPYGVPVFDEYYGPTGAFRGTETCDVAAYMWSQNLLLTISGQGRLADRIERAFFNAGPATVSRDFKSHVYMQSPNRMADKSLPAAGQFTYQTKHDPLCCTAAVNRILPNYVINMWMATRDNGLAAVCYGPCKVSALVADHVPVELVCKTNYPFNETIEITVKPAREATFPLMLRIPGWCKSTSWKGTAITWTQPLMPTVLCESNGSGNRTTGYLSSSACFLKSLRGVTRTEAALPTLRYRLVRSCLRCRLPTRRMRTRPIRRRSGSLRSMRKPAIPAPTSSSNVAQCLASGTGRWRRR